MDLTRRRLLACGSIAGIAAVAGCLDEAATGDPGAGDGANDDNDSEENDDGGNDESDGDETDGSESEASDDSDGTDSDGEDDENGDDSDDEDAETNDADDDDDESTYAIVDYESLAYDDARRVDETNAEVLLDADEARRTLDLGEQSEETRADLDEFIEETDFDRSVLLALYTRGPNLCYEFELGDVGVDEGNVEVSAAAVDGSEADEGCAEAEAALSMLVRVEFEDGTPNGGNISIRDGWGNEHGMGYATASDSAEGDERGNGE